MSHLLLKWVWWSTLSHKKKKKKHAGFPCFYFYQGKPFWVVFDPQPHFGMFFFVFSGGLTLGIWSARSAVVLPDELEDPAGLR